MRKFGANMGEALYAAEVGVGHGVQVADRKSSARRPALALYPVAVYVTPEIPNPESGKRRTTLDAEIVQRGEVWFVHQDGRNNFLMDEARFIRQIRIHRIKLRPFVRNHQSGRITSAGALTMDIPAVWQCPQCGKRAEGLTYAQMKRMQLQSKAVICADCQKPLVRTLPPVQRVNVDDPAQLATAKQLYAMFKAGPTAETPNMFPRVWASYRVDSAPPDEAWTIDPDDAEALRMDAALRERGAVPAAVEGTVMLVEPKAAAPGCGWRVWVSPSGSSEGAMRSAVAGKVGKIVRPAGEAVDAPTRAMAFDIVVEIVGRDGVRTPVSVPYGAALRVSEGDEVEFGKLLASPADWVPHEIPGANSLIVAEGEPVGAGQWLSEGFTLRPVKVAMALGSAGVKAVFMETTRNDAGEFAHKLGWMSWQSLTGGLSDAYGYPVYAAREPAQKAKPRSSSCVAAMA